MGTGTGIVLATDLAGLGPRRQGKVRDIYDLGTELLLIATDRISAFDVVLAEGIPGKGAVLTQMSEFWFRWFDGRGGAPPHHLITTDPDRFPDACRRYREILAGRTMLVKKTRPFPVECIVRGYLSGSGWKEYQKQGSVSGVRLPAGLRESERLPTPIFTPSTKAESGHDENIAFEQMAERIGPANAEALRAASLSIYRAAAAYADDRGIIIADTKLEFGLDPATGQITLIDEVLTPDSSRFWPADGYAPGRPQPSFDKQFVRDYLLSVRWNQKPPAPSLPAEVVANTRQKYHEALARLTGAPPRAC